MAQDWQQAAQRARSAERRAADDPSRKNILAYRRARDNADTAFGGTGWRQLVPAK